MRIFQGKYFLSSILVILSFAITLNAQPQDSLFTGQHFSGLKFRSIGPAFMAGRIADIACLLYTSISNCIFKSNSGSSGGAILGIISPVSFVIENNIFTNNSGSRGGALYFGETDPIIRNNIISNNVANDVELNGTLGGGIYLFQSNALVINNRIDSNYAYKNGNHSRGGGICAIYGTPNIINNQMKGNESGHGGAIYLSGGGIGNNKMIVKGNLLDSNVANLFGGAVYCFCNSSIDSNFIYRNKVGRCV